MKIKQTVLISLCSLIALLLSACAGAPLPAGEETAVSPITFTGEANGCGDIFLYKANDNHTQYLRLEIHAATLALTTTPITINLEEQPDAITATIDVYSDPVEQLGEFPYCNDVGPSAIPQTSWQATSGTATITLSSDNAPFNCQGDRYEATVLLQNIVFQSNNQEYTLESTSFNNITVGWCSG